MKVRATHPFRPTKMFQSFFDVTPIELGQLGPEPAVAVLREMIWAEVNNLGIPISATDIPFAITTSDGGVDAVVDGIPTCPGNGLIFAPRTCYQVKAGSFTLNATSPAQIESLLIAPSAIKARINSKAAPAGKAHKAEQISPRIRECLDSGGTFVTMLFGNDNIDTGENATKRAIQSFLSEIDPKYANAKINVWRQSAICGLLRQFPAVSLQIKNLAGFFRCLVTVSGQSAAICSRYSSLRRIKKQQSKDCGSPSGMIVAVQSMCV